MYMYTYVYISQHKVNKFKWIERSPIWRTALSILDNSKYENNLNILSKKERANKLWLYNDRGVVDKWRKDLDQRN